MHDLCDVHTDYKIDFQTTLAVFYESKPTINYVQSITKYISQEQ